MGEEVNEAEFKVPDENSEAVIRYELSNEQRRIAREVKENYVNGLNTLIYAVCGAGKTELVFSVIEYALKNNLKVGFAIPRRDVVIELTTRFKKVFIHNTVTNVYGGNTSNLVGDIIVLTTHQLYRYPHHFDLLIMDEIDAFPYKDNPVLISLFKRCINGNYVLMSATPSKSVLEEFKQPGHKILTLFTRYHMKPIPVPKIVISFGVFKFYFLIKKIKEYENAHKPCFVFVATIDECEYVFNVIKKYVPLGNCVHSKVKDRSVIIDAFRHGKYKYLVTTAVLERGVTLKNLQVIIFNADHNIYNSASLIQISGRVGRVKDAPDGEVIFLGEKKTNDMEEAIKKTKEANEHLQTLLQRH
ncbi:MAG: helicase-related protein [Bacilli bacterium]|jgi:competence protein ComFA